MCSSNVAEEIKTKSACACVRKWENPVSNLRCHNAGISRRYATAAFASAVLRGETEPGVWYPEEDGALKDRPRLLEAAAKGCTNYEINKAAWMLESKPINLGMGMYLEM